MIVEIEFDALAVIDGEEALTDDDVRRVLETFRVVQGPVDPAQIELVKRAGTWRIRIPIPKEGP